VRRSFLAIFIPLASLVLLLAGCPSASQGPSSPSIPTRTHTDSTTPTASASLTATPSMTATQTLTLAADTATLTPPLTSTSTLTSTASLTSTPSPTSTATLTRTNTPVPPTLTSTSTQSPTGTLTSTSTLTTSPTSTFSPTGTSTLSPSPTPSATPTATNSFSATATPSPSFTPTGTLPIPTDTPSCLSTSSFGVDSIGSNAYPSLPNVFAQKAVLGASVPVTVLSLSAHFTAIGGPIRAAIYGDNGSGTSPTTLICESAPFSLTGSGWKVLDLPDTILSGPATYWLALQTPFGGTSTSISFEPGGPANSWAYGNGTGYVYGPFPMNFAPYQNYADYLSIHANFCNPSGTVTDTPTITETRTFTLTRTPTPTPTLSQTPVCLDTTSFGVGSIGSSAYPSLPNVFAQKAVLNASVPVTVLSLSAHFTAIGGPIRAAIYGDNGSGTSPSTLICESVQFSLTGSGWKVFDLPDTILSGPATYWLALQTPFGGTATSISFEPGGSANSWAYGNGSGYVYGPFPTNYSLYQTYSDDLSIHANFCNPAGTATQTPTITLTRTPTLTPTPTSTRTSTRTPVPTDTPACAPTASFGVTTIGAGAYPSLPYVFAQRATLSGSLPVTVMSLSAHFTQIGGPVRAAIYKDDGGGTSPTGLLVESMEFSPAGSGWVVLDLPDTVLDAPGTYWLALQTPFGGTATSVSYDASAPSEIWAYGSGAGYSYGPFPSPYQLYATYPQDLSIHANYCP